jgi:hypothetical protein
VTALEVLAACHPRSVVLGPYNDVRQVSGRDVRPLVDQGLAEIVRPLGLLKARLTVAGVSVCEEEGWL